MASENHPNRLIGESSPYLLQHAHNPVDWHPWGPEALESAQAADKPIFLSIGYSACHWCHVMERESFENVETAALMNTHFVNIKVDREERPDLDQIYMTAVQMLTGQGGWPMSVFLTPELKPFYGGTYFPPEPRHRMPSFRDVLRGVAKAWSEQRDQVLGSGATIVEHLRAASRIDREEGALGIDLIERAAVEIERAVDHRWGGLGRAPKFPHSVELRLLLRAAARTGVDDYRRSALFSLECMIRGGIYDQLGGGFHRYSTDERWLVPHFEKMLYDNALITLACLEAYQTGGDPIFRRAATETLEYVLRRMTDPGGGFHSAEDADSEGVEGKFYVWTRAEIEAVLDQREAEIFAHCFDVTSEGNWEGVCILNLVKTLDEASEALGIPETELAAIIDRCKGRLLSVRDRRVAPGRDEKILTSWNGMMIEAFAVAAQVLDEPRYARAAVRAAEFLLTTMRSENGLLLRTAKDGRAKLNAYLEDYAYLANALVSLYEATFEPRWLTAASELVERMIEQFWDPEEGGFFYTGNDHETLIVRGKDPADGAIPSGNAMAVTAMERLAKLTGRGDLAAKTETALKLFRGQMSRSPVASAQLLIALGLHLGPTVEFAFVAEPDGIETRQSLNCLHRRFLPDKVVALKRPTENDEAADPVPLLMGKKSAGAGPTIYLCRAFACQEPVVGFEAFSDALNELNREPE